MAAISPYYINSPSTVDTQIGLNADLAGMLIDSCAFSAERTEVEHANFAGVASVHITNAPKFTATFTAKVMARASGISNFHPGLAINKAYITQFRAGVNNGFSTESTEGWWVLGNVSRTQPRGDLDEVSFPLRLFAFPTSTTGTLINANPSAPT